MTLYIESNDLIGDAMMQIPMFKAYKKSNPENKIVYVSPLQSLNRICFEHNPYLDGHITDSELWKQIKEGDQYIRIKCTDAFDIGLQNKHSMIKGFGKILNVPVEDEKYEIYLTEDEIENGRKLVENFSNGKPVIVCARHSRSCSSNDPKIKVPNKCWSNKIWVQFANKLIDDGFVPLAIGSTIDENDPKYLEWPGPKLYGESLRTVAGVIKAAKATICVETGIRFIASAVGASYVCIACAVPNWLIYGVPTNSEQKICEENIPLNMVSADICRRLLNKVL